MVRIQFPGQTSMEGATLPATVENGLLIEVRDRRDLARLIDLCGEILLREEWTVGPQNTRLLPNNFFAEPFTQLAGALMAGALSSERVDNEDNEEPEKLAERVLNANPDAQNPFEALLIGLAMIYQLWPAEIERREDRLVMLLGLGYPANRIDDQVSLTLSKPHAALWMGPGSLLVGLSVGASLKLAKWGALVARPLISTTADRASRDLIEELRNEARFGNVYLDLPRLDVLFPEDRAKMQGRQVLVVLLHGLFGTDLGTFDGFISQLRRSTPKQLCQSLDQLKGSAGIDQLSADFEAVLQCNPIMELCDYRLRDFIEENVAWLGWPHDSLAPIDTSAIALAALLNKELKTAAPRHVVFVCHSQGGLLARQTALYLMQMKSPVKWADHLAGIITFGTPHEGAAIAEPGFQGGREAAIYLMMLSGTKKATSLGNVLTLLGERVAEGIENLKPFNASTKDRPTAFAAKLLKEEGQVAWANGKNRPNMLLVGGKLDTAQRKSLKRKLAAGFISHKIGHDDHDLVVELKSSTSSLLDANVTIQVKSDHFSYFDGNSDSKQAVDAAVAFIWTLLKPEITEWCRAQAARDSLRDQAPWQLHFRQDPPTPPNATEK